MAVSPTFAWLRLWPPINLRTAYLQSRSFGTIAVQHIIRALLLATKNGFSLQHENPAGGRNGF
jgi:hypothetical protein